MAFLSTRRSQFRSFIVTFFKGPKVPLTWLLSIFFIWLSYIAWRRDRVRRKQLAHKRHLMQYWAKFGRSLRFGLDIGGTLAKLVFFEPDLCDSIHLETKEKIRLFISQSTYCDDRLQFHSNKLNGTIHFIKFPSSAIHEFIEQVRAMQFNNNDISNYSLMALQQQSNNNNINNNSNSSISAATTAAANIASSSIPIRRNTDFTNSSSSSSSSSKFSLNSVIANSSSVLSFTKSIENNNNKNKSSTINENKSKINAISSSSAAAAAVANSSSSASTSSSTSLSPISLFSSLTSILFPHHTNSNSNNNNNNNPDDSNQNSTHLQSSFNQLNSLTSATQATISTILNNAANQLPNLPNLHLYDNSSSSSSNSSSSLSNNNHLNNNHNNNNGDSNPPLYNNSAWHVSSNSSTDLSLSSSTTDHLLSNGIDNNHQHSISSSSASVSNYNHNNNIESQSNSNSLSNNSSSLLPLSSLSSSDNFNTADVAVPVSSNNTTTSTVTDSTRRQYSRTPRLNGLSPSTSSSSSSSSNANFIRSRTLSFPPPSLSAIQQMNKENNNNSINENNNNNGWLQSIISSNAASSLSSSTPINPTVCATGGGAFKFHDTFIQRLGVELYITDELESLVRGIDFMIHTLPDECYYLSQFLFKLPIEKQIYKEISYPYLVVNIGSGVSILRVLGPNQFERIGGTSVGGGTFYGLCRILTDCKSFEEALELAANGHSSAADLLVGDIYGGDYLSLGLSSDSVAASFGKLIRDDSLKHVRKEDLAKAALVMITNNIGSLANLYAHKVLHVPQIIFVGNFLHGNEIAKRGLAFATDYWSNKTAKALFLHHEGFFGAVGSLLT